MSNDGRRPNEYATARKATAVLCFVVAAALAILDAFRPDFEVSPLVLVPFLVVGAALLAVEVNISR